MNFIVILLAFFLDGFLIAAISYWHWDSSIRGDSHSVCQGGRLTFMLATGYYSLVWSFGFGALPATTAFLWNSAVGVWLSGLALFWGRRNPMGRCLLLAFRPLPQGDDLEKISTAFGDSKKVYVNFFAPIFDLSVFLLSQISGFLLWFSGISIRFQLGLFCIVRYPCLLLPLSSANNDLSQSARRVEALFELLPIRIMTCLFASTGHFLAVFFNWRKKVFSGSADI